MTALQRTAIGYQTAQVLADAPLVQCMLGMPLSLIRAWTNLTWSVIGLNVVALEHGYHVTNSLINQQYRVLLAMADANQQMFKQGQEVLVHHLEQDRTNTTHHTAEQSFADRVTTALSAVEQPSTAPATTTVDPAEQPPAEFATTELNTDKSFYFRGPERLLNLQAENLAQFVQLASEVDDTTWLYHLRQGDYTHWFRTVIGDDVLCGETLRLEQGTDMSAAESRAYLIALIEQRYPDIPR